MAGKAPVVLFVYSRLDKTQNCIAALERNHDCSQTDLYIFADGAKNDIDKEKVEMVRLYIKKQYIPESRFSKVYLTESDYNKGLAASIINGVTAVINQYGRVIVVEDDLIVSDDFLEYMNGALDYYEKISRIGSVSAYTYPLPVLKRYKKDVYMLRKGECWGWGTWRDRWQDVDWEVSTFGEYQKNSEMRKEFDSIGTGLDAMLCSYMEGTLDTWATRWCYHLYRKKLLTVYPRIGRTNNLGLDGTGTNCSVSERFECTKIGSDRRCKFEMLEVDKKLEKAVSKYDAGEISVGERVKRGLSRLKRKL